MPSLEFSVLDEVLELAKAGHINAARSRWQATSQEFRLRTMRLVSVLCMSTEPTDKIEGEITINSPFGDFSFTQEKFDTMKRYIPIVVATNG